VTFSVWIQESNAWDKEGHGHDCGRDTWSNSEVCYPDIWCRIKLPDGEQVRTDTVSNDVTAKWDESEALTVTLDKDDYIDIKCWDADGGDDQESLGWKHIPSTNFFPCGMETQEFSLKLAYNGGSDSFGGYDSYNNKIVVSVASESPDVQEWCAAYQNIIDSLLPWR